MSIILLLAETNIYWVMIPMASRKCSQYILQKLVIRYLTKLLCILKYLVQLHLFESHLLLLTKMNLSSPYMYYSMHNAGNVYEKLYIYTHINACIFCLNFVCVHTYLCVPICNETRKEIKLSNSWYIFLSLYFFFSFPCIYEEEREHNSF